MSVSITGGRIRQRFGGMWAVETFSQGTATAFQDLSLTTRQVNLGMGTATGFTRNRYTATAGTEGQMLTVAATATGEAHLLFLQGTATGMWVFGEADDFIEARYFNSKWHVLTTSGATVATAT